MITPRVTVPVERAEYERLIGVTEDLIREVSDPGTEALAAVYCARRILDQSAMLSAAPAPEGGAVSIWSDARNVFVRYAELFAMTERYEEASAIADKAAHEIEALATREEAPADHISDARQMVEAPAGAGENVNWKAEYEAVCEARISDRQKSQEVINERDKWIAELIQERDALRAQPQARSGEGQ